MQLAVTTDIPGGTREQYEQVFQKASGGNVPDGCLLHVAGPTDSGWRIITVWESEDAFQQFFSNRVTPARDEAGVAEPRVERFEVYRLLQA